MPMVCPYTIMSGTTVYLDAHSTLFMTTTLQPFYTIFESKDATQRDAAFELDELKDIATHGMSGGVSGFIYTKDLVEWFDENDDEIQDYLSDWVSDNIGDEQGSFAYFAPLCEDITQLKCKLVWSYVELKAHEILCQVDPNY